MSLATELVKKIKELKSCETVITFPSGVKIISKRNESGEWETDRILNDSPGFVVDDRPDLEMVEILPFLCLSSQDPAQDSILLKKHEITHVLSVGVYIPIHLRSPDIKYYKVELVDEPNENINGVLESCIKFIEDARKESKKVKVLVHCNAGYSRGPSIVIGYLMKNFGYSYVEAFDTVRRKRNVKPNDGFIKYLKELESKS